MKNIHVLSTDKPSNIVIATIDGKLKLNNNINDSVEYNGKNQHIHITSDEEIKEGDYGLTPRGHIGKCTKVADGWVVIEKYGSFNIGNCKKIILTTDQDLIKDGVQAIDDEFLEWFVNNPNCEWIEVIYGLYNQMGRKVSNEKVSENHSQCVWKYKIIIPKTTQQIIDEDFAGGLEMEQIIPKQEKIYSEEDVKNAFLDGWQLRDGDLPFPKAKKKWFNEFKKE